MTQAKRDLLELLRFELKFLEQRVRAFSTHSVAANENLPRLSQLSEFRRSFAATSLQCMFTNAVCPGGAEKRKRAMLVYPPQRKRGND
jgi:hypothetical protein